jgi:hypothetical protein
MVQVRDGEDGKFIEPIPLPAFPHRMQLVAEWVRPPQPGEVLPPYEVLKDLLVLPDMPLLREHGS